MTVEKLLAGPAALAFLVNESRARLPETSGDHIARLWARKPMDTIITELWADFSRSVYPHDDIELSVRNRYFLQELRSFFSDNQGSFINIAAGFTSYPYYLNSKVKFYELDLENIIEYKEEMASYYVKNGNIDYRDINYINFDFQELSIDRMKYVIQSAPLPRFVLLEGISYYLPNQVWSVLLEIMRSMLSQHDVLMFDF